MSKIGSQMRQGAPTNAPTETDEDAAFIKGQFKEGEAALRGCLQNYCNAGERLAKKKAELGHGNWKRWLEENEIKQQRANECIRLFEGWGKLPPGGDLGLKKAIRFLATGSTGKATSAPAKEEFRGSAGIELPLALFPPEKAEVLNKYLTALKATLVLDNNNDVILAALRDAAHDALCAIDKGSDRPSPARLSTRGAQSVYLNTTQSDDWLDWLENGRKFPDAKHYKQLLSTNVNVYKPDGSLLLALRKKAVRSGWLFADSAVIRTALKPDPRRGRKVGGGNPNFRSSTIGYIRGQETSLTQRYPDDFQLIVDLAKIMNDAFRGARLPDEYQAHKAAVSAVPRTCRIDATCFTTIQCNHHNDAQGLIAQMPYHTDQGNISGVLGLLSVFGNFTGGYLVFPKYQIAIDLRPRDLLIADTGELHGNMPICGQRLSVVVFAHTTNIPLAKVSE